MINLDNLAEASAKEVFNQVKNHLLTQNQRSLNVKGLCAYRNNQGLRCAAGCLITDEQYNPKIESFPWEWLVSKKMISVDQHKDLITRLQRIHDLYDPESWPDKLNELQQALGLF